MIYFYAILFSDIVSTEANLKKICVKITKGCCTCKFEYVGDFSTSLVKGFRSIPLVCGERSGPNKDDF